MPKNKEITKSEFYCTECGKRGIPIARRAGQQREAGHLKRLYCLHCKKETNHAEIRPFGAYNYEDFKKEFDLGRFVNGQKTPVSELISCTKTDCKYNVDGRCWNSKENYDCGHRIILKSKPEHEGCGLERDR